MRAVIVFAAGLVLRFGLIAKFPVIFGGDPMVRLLHRDKVFISHQLPLLQAIVHAISLVTHDYVMVQIAMAVIGAMAGVAFYWLARDLVAEPAAFWAALMLTTNPLIAAESIVPFQESLMLLLIFLAFHFFYTDRVEFASLALGLACLTRFEAWIAAPVLAVAYWHRTRDWRGVLWFGWAPVAWLIYQRGLAPAGTYVVESHITIARLMRWVYLAYITAKFTPVIVLALGAIGLWFLWKNPGRWAPLIAFFGLFVMALLFSAHGDWPDPERRVASREAHLWIAAVVLMSAIAMEKLTRFRDAIAAAAVILGAWGAYEYVKREASDPQIHLSYRLAKFFDAALQPGERALILAPPWPSHVFDFYLERARATGGEAGYQAALRNLAASDQSPPAYQRTLVHSRFDRDRLVAESQSCTPWVAVWSDYGTPPTDLPAPRIVLRAGDRSVRVIRRECR
jgi:hypothetical protein